MTDDIICKVYLHPAVSDYSDYEVTVLQGHCAGLVDYCEAMKNLITLETSDGNIAEAAARLAGIATGGRARAVVFLDGGEAECSEGIDDKDRAEAFARKLCEKLAGPVEWPELSVFAAVTQVAAVGLYTPAFAPIKDSRTVLGAVWCEPPVGREDFLKDFEAVCGIIAASLQSRQRFVLTKARRDMALSLLDNMDACMCIIDLETDEILYINSHMQEDYGFKEDVTGKKCWQVFERDKIGRCHFCPAYLLEKNPEEPIVWEKHSEISGKYYKCTDSIIRWIDGRNAHMQYSVDISAEKAVQQSFIEAKQTVDVAKSHFLSRLSHEMRTPLNAIMGMARIGMSAADLDRAKECIEKINSSSHMLHLLINDVLDISKIESSKMELLHEPFDFERMLAKVSAEATAMSEEKRQKLHIRIDENMPHDFLGDEARVAQVMSNLLSNAVKFTPNGGSILMEINEKTRISNYSVIEVKVADTGIGIPKERIPTLFTAFSQIDGSFTRKYGGTGLGLVISKSIVNMMNGDIYVESELGKGSTFIFNIELERGESGAGGAAQTGMDSHKNKKRHLFAGYRILIADDEEINRDVLIMALEDTRLKIECAQNGKEAADKFAANPNAYDLILMDLEMPELDGLEATRVIRGMSSERAKKIPILAMIADAFGDGAKKSLEAGMNDYLSKPVDFDQLFNKLRHYLVEYSLPPDRAEDAADAQAAAAKSEFPEIEGLSDFIDVADALGRVRGNRKIYKTLLQSFATNSGVAEMKEDIQNKRFSPAAKTAHSIKGASANLSLVAVYRSAALLESQLKMDYCNENDLAAFEAVFEETKKYIDKLITQL